MTVSRQYTQELRDNINYSATWLPTITVSPGDIGRLVNYEYQPVTSLAALQIPFEITAGNVQTDFDYASAGSVSLVFKASGQAPLAGSGLAQGEAGFHIQFSRENAVVFRAVNCLSTIIKERVQLEKEIINRYRAGDWQKDWVVIVEAVSADSSTILISSGTQAHLDLRAGGKASVAVYNLADVNARFEIVQESNMATKILAKSSLTPLFRSAAILDRLFQRSVVLRGKDKDEPHEDLFLKSVDYDNYSADS